MREFVAWYNYEHRHSGIGLLTPSTVHAGQAADVLAARHAVMQSAYAAHPERFVRGVPVVAALPSAVWINPPTTEATQKGGSTPITSPQSGTREAIVQEMTTSGDTL